MKLKHPVFKLTVSSRPEDPWRLQAPPCWSDYSSGPWKTRRQKKTELLDSLIHNVYRNGWISCLKPAEKHDFIRKFQPLKQQSQRTVESAVWDGEGRGLWLYDSQLAAAPHNKKVTSLNTGDGLLQAFCLFYPEGPEWKLGQWVSSAPNTQKITWDEI